MKSFFDLTISRKLPHTLGLRETYMLQLFVSVEARQEANLSYHQYEWSILANLRLAKIHSMRILKNSQKPLRLHKKAFSKREKSFLILYVSIFSNS
jgi:hypothetical protein